MLSTELSGNVNNIASDAGSYLSHFIFESCTAASTCCIDVSSKEMSLPVGISWNPYVVQKAKDYSSSVHKELTVYSP